MQGSNSFGENAQEKELKSEYNLNSEKTSARELLKKIEIKFKIENDEDERERKEEIFSKSMPIFSKSENKNNKSGDNRNEISEIVQNSFFSINKETSDNSNNNCLICYDNLANSVFMNCGHGGY